MKWLKSFRIFESIIRRYRESDVKEIGYITKNVEIRIDVEAIGHVLYDRKWRHGTTAEQGKIVASITEDEIIETIENAIEQITISLMQDEFDIYQNSDNYPTRGIKAGDPNRFVIKNKENNLNIVCQLEPGEEQFTLTVITVMKKADFKAYHGQYVVEIGAGPTRSYIFN
jgi:hypothetical protein